MILGIDEVGRGPWAGPLVVGAVVLGGAEIDGLTDSKKLSKKRREELDIVIREQAAGFGLGWVEAIEIDEIGLSAALKLATRRAVEGVRATYHEIIIDGTVNFLAETSKGEYVTTMKKADLLVPSVSAASIIAKVARDNFMSRQDEIYPGYNFKSHVGYGTAAHIAAIEKLGVTPLHRLSFAPLQKYREEVPGSVVASKHLQPKRDQKPGPLSRLVQSRFDQESSREPTKKQVSGQAAADILDRKYKQFSDVAFKNTKQIGNEAETVAASYLKKLGHKILDRNWKNRFCEIDIVSKKADKLYFTEVKYRRSVEHGDGLEAITPKKLKQMRFAAEYYMTAHKINDTAACLCTMSLTGRVPEIESFLDIF